MTDQLFPKRVMDTFTPEVEAILTLPDVDQNEEFWNVWADEPHKCCFGARADKALSKEKDQRSFYYGDGVTKLCNKLDVTEKQLSFALWACGARIDPFDTYAWPNTVESVLQRVKGLEWVPNTIPYDSWYGRAFGSLEFERVYEDTDREPYYDLMCLPDTPENRTKMVNKLIIKVVHTLP